MATGPQLELLHAAVRMAIPLAAAILAASPANAGSGEKGRGRGGSGDAARVIRCEGEYPYHLQGVATDGESIFWSFTTTLVKTDRQGRLLAKVEKRRQDGHMGDLCCRGGKVFVATGKSQKEGSKLVKLGYEVCEYDAGTLELLASHPTPEMVWGNNGIEFFDGSFWCVSGAPRHFPYNMVVRYTEDFRFVQTLMVESGWTNCGVQTICRHGDKMLFGCYGDRKDAESPHGDCTFVVDCEKLAAAQWRSPVPCERRVEKRTSEGMLVLDGTLMEAHGKRLSKMGEAPARWAAQLSPIEL